MGGNIYVTGGSHNGDNLNSVYVYDLQADAWTQLASMSTARRGHASAAVSGKLYVFGGFGDGGKVGKVEVYDPASDSWALANMTTARSNVAAVAL